MHQKRKYLYLTGVITTFLFISGCGRNETADADVVLNTVMEETTQESAEEEITTEEYGTETVTIEETTGTPVVIDIPYAEEIRTLIEKYNEYWELLVCDSEKKKLITAVNAEHRWSAYILSYDEFSTLEELAAYWRQYFTEAYYEYYIGRYFFEQDGKLCIGALVGDPYNIVFETVSDFEETEQGFTAFFDRRSHNCFDDNHTDKVKVNFVWENDVLKISEIEKME